MSGLRRKELAIAVALSALLTIALFHLTLEAPEALGQALSSYLPPDVAFDVEAMEGVISALRPVGYASLAATAALIALGFATKKGALASLGSLALYLPTFGYFASAMFFLAGLGALRALWLPILEACPAALKLGCVAYLPLEAVLPRPSLNVVGMAIMLAGLFVFSLGAATWLYGKFMGYGLVDFWIYRYSRHPQYLGFILWSYGLLVFVSYKPYARGAFATPPALIWLASTMVVVAAALCEELEMARRHGGRYEEYRRRAPFMAPLPSPLARAIALPMRAVGGYPRSARGVAAVVALYFAILVALSYALMVALGV